MNKSFMLSPEIGGLLEMTIFNTLTIVKLSPQKDPCVQTLIGGKMKELTRTGKLLTTSDHFVTGSQAGQRQHLF